MTQPPEQPPTQRAPHDPPPHQPPPPGQQYPTARSAGLPPAAGYAPTGANGPYGPYGGGPSPYQPPRTAGGGKTALIIVAVVALVLLLFCGGIAGLLIWAANRVEDGFDEFDGDRRGGPDNPISVEVGEAFEIDGVDYAAGWRVQPGADQYDEDTIVGLKGENNRDDKTSETVSLRFTFVDGDTELGTINCYSDGAIGYGNTEEITCKGYDAIPDAYGGIEVSAAY